MNRKIILDVKVSETVFNALLEKASKDQISQNGNIVYNMDLEDSTAPDELRLALLKLATYEKR